MKSIENKYLKLASVGKYNILDQIIRNDYNTVYDSIYKSLSNVMYNMGVGDEFHIILNNDDVYIYQSDNEIYVTYRNQQLFGLFGYYIPCNRMDTYLMNLTNDICHHMLSNDFFYSSSIDLRTTDIKYILKVCHYNETWLRLMYHFILAMNIHLHDNYVFSVFDHIFNVCIDVTGSSVDSCIITTSYDNNTTNTESGILELVDRIIEIIKLNTNIT